MKKYFLGPVFFILFLIPLFTKGQYQVVPAFREATTTNGNFKLTSGALIVADAGSYASLEQDMKIFAADLKTVTGQALSVRQGKPEKGDLYFTLKDNDDALGKEGYQMEIGQQITVRANTATGAFYAMQSLLQLFEQNIKIRKGTVRDYPQYRERGFMIDVGRKYFEMDYLEKLIRKLAWQKMNFIHIHFTEWNGFRLKSDLFPGLASKQAYSKEDIREIQDYATKYHITVVPEIDLPAHSTIITDYNPFLGFRCPSMRASWWQETYIKEGKAWTLDITRREVRSWIKALLDEWIPLFDGPYFHIGGDEYQYDKDKYACDELMKAAKKMGYKYPGDVFVDFVNEINKQVMSYGKTTQIWNWWRFSQNADRINKTSIQPDKNIVINAWNRPRLEGILADGYQVIITSETGPEALYVTPGMNATKPGEYGYFDSKYIYEKWIPQTGIQVRGFKVCLWTNRVEDKPDEWFDPYIQLPIAVLSERIWGGKRDKTLEEFEKRLTKTKFPF